MRIEVQLSAVKISGSTAFCVSVRDGRVLRASETVLHATIYCVMLGTYGDLCQDDISVRTSTATAGTAAKQQAGLDDEVQLYAEFGRRYVYFCLQIA